MTLKVSDKICEGYITPQWPLPPSTVVDALSPDRHTSLEGRLGVEFGTDKWGLIPGVAPMLVGVGQNGRRIMGMGGNMSGPNVPRNSFGNIWVPDTFTPDHYAEVAHNPPKHGEWAHTTEVLDCGPAVRQDPNSDSCYCMGLWYHDSGSSHPDIHISRINNGVRTRLAVVTLEPRHHGTDWWYIQLQVWGQNPVKLRVVTKAPTIYVPGTATIDSAGYLPGTVTYTFPPEFGGTIRFSQYEGDVTKPGEPSEFELGRAKGTWAEYGVAPANEDGVPGLGETVAGQRVWTVWEGEDSSPNRLLTGQPGVRALLNVPNLPMTGDGFSDFVAGDLDGRLTIRVITPGTTMTIGGYKASGSTVSVLTAITVVSLTQTDTTWEATVTDYEAFSSISVSDGTTTAEVNSDFTAPTVGTFTVPPTSSSLTIPITALEATDNFGVTGYIVTSDNTPPFKTDTRWTTAAYWISNGYPVTAAGTHTLYAWAKDAAGNVSSPLTATTEVHEQMPVAPTWQTPSTVADYGAVALYWNAGANANSYTVFYSRNSTLDGATYDGVNPYPLTPGLDNGKVEGIAGLTQLVAGLRDNTTYYFKVAAVNTTGSAVSSFTSKATLRNPQVTVSPVEGTYASAVTVTLTRANYTGGSIYYTLDGSDPKTNGVVYSAPFVVASSATLRVQAYEAVGNGVWGEAKSYGYFIPPMVNVIPPAGAYASPQTVTITPANFSGGAIYYTLDGSMPTTASTLYTGPIAVSSSATIKVLPVDGGGTPGTVQTLDYTIIPRVAFSATPYSTYDDLSKTVTIYYSTSATGVWQDQRRQTAEAFGTVKVGAAVAVAQAKDAQAVAGSVKIGAVVSVGQKAQTATISAAVKESATAASAQARQTTAASAATQYGAQVTQRQAAQSQTVAAQSGAAVSTIRFAAPNPPIVDANGVIHYTTEEVVYGYACDVAQMQPLQQAVLAAGLALTASSDATQAKQSQTSAAGMLITAAVTADQSAQSQSIAAKYLAPDSAEIVQTQPRQGQVSAAELSFAASIAQTQRPQHVDYAIVAGGPHEVVQLYSTISRSVELGSKVTAKVGLISEITTSVKCYGDTIGVD